MPNRDVALNFNPGRTKFSNVAVFNLVPVKVGLFPAKDQIRVEVVPVDEEQVPCSQGLVEGGFHGVERVAPSGIRFEQDKLFFRAFDVAVAGLLVVGFELFEEVGW